MLINQWYKKQEENKDPPSGAPPADPPADPPAGDPPAGPAAFPDDWRTQMAGEDAKLAKQLERFTKPNDFGKAFNDAQNRIREGDLLKPLPADSSDEDKTAFREQQGIPAEAAGYLSELPDGLVIGEDDKEMMESFAGIMHEQNAPPGLVHAAIAWYNNLQPQQDAAMADIDAADQTEFEDAKRLDWGTEYRANLNVVTAFVDSTFPEEDAAAFLNARGPDGKALFNRPGIMDGLVKVGRMMNPGSAILPAGVNDLGKGVDERITEIEEFMRTDRPSYNKNQKMQDEYVELLGAQIKMKERNAA
jgi:hypothetical protein